jgi:predicted AlkP superfamily pyrophosphatase or phosphodiesterase
MSKLLSVITFLIVFLGACPKSMAAETDRYVVLISVDGLAASYLNDPNAHLPTLRMLMKKGAHARGMVTTFPSSTWPSHTSLITGTHPAKHGVIGNSVWDRSTGQTVTYIGDKTFTKQEAIRVPTLYDAAHGAGLKTAAIIWPSCNGADTLDFMIPDSNVQATHDKYTTPGLAEELAAANISIRKLGAWGWGHEFSPARDLTYARAASYLLDKHQPNLLMLHLITPDGVQHDYGPQTEEAYWSVNDADNHIRMVWQTLQKPPFKDKATLIVVSDHGFAPYDKIIRPYHAFKDAGLIDFDSKGKITRQQVRVHAHGGACGVYILDDKNREAIQKNVIQAALKIPGVTRVLTPEQFTQDGMPHPSENPQQADLMILAEEPGYTFYTSTTGKLLTQMDQTKGGHGHYPKHDYMHATFIAVGAGIQPGAKLLGIELPDADGRALNEILAP